MAVRQLIVFRHNCELGCAPAYTLFDTVAVSRREGVVCPRAYSDYAVSVDTAALPEGVSCTQMV